MKRIAPAASTYPKHPVHKMGKFTHFVYGIKWVRNISWLVWTIYAWQGHARKVDERYKELSKG